MQKFFFFSYISELGGSLCYINKNDHPFPDQLALLTTREAAKGRVNNFFSYFVGKSEGEGGGVN